MARLLVQFTQSIAEAQSILRNLMLQLYVLDYLQVRRGMSRPMRSGSGSRVLSKVEQRHSHAPLP